MNLAFPGMHCDDDDSDDDEDDNEDSEADPPFLACRPCRVDSLLGVVKTRELLVKVFNRIQSCQDSPSFDVLLNLLDGIVDDSDLLILLFHQNAHL